MQSNVLKLKPRKYEVHKLDNNMNLEVLYRGTYDECKDFMLEHFGHMTVEKFLDLDILIS